MPATKILWGQVLLVSFVVLAFLWAATEWTAWRLGFQAQLGQRWFTFVDWPLYQPPAFFWWWFANDAYARDIFVEGAYIAGSGGVAAFVVVVAMSVWRAREAKHTITYGSARWATPREIRDADLLHLDGAILGRWRGTYLRHDEHVVCFAPTRSGKGVGSKWSGLKCRRIFSGIVRRTAEMRRFTRTEPFGRRSRIGLPPWMSGHKALVWQWMKDVR